MNEALFNRDFDTTVGAQKIAIQNIDPVTKAITPALRVTFAVEKSDNLVQNRACTVDIGMLDDCFDLLVDSSKHRLL